MTHPGSPVYENLVIRAFLTNEASMWTEAHAFSIMNRFTKDQLDESHANIDRWMRLHGISKMKDDEKNALLLVQAWIRRWLVRNTLKQRRDLYTRLAHIDSLDHCKTAMVLNRVLARAWEHVHRGQDMVHD